MSKLTKQTYWTLDANQALEQYQSSIHELSDEEVSQNLKRYGTNTLSSTARFSPLRLLLQQFNNPIMYILIIATVISGLSNALVDSIFILAIILASVVLSFIQEHTATSGSNNSNPVFNNNRLC